MLDKKTCILWSMFIYILWGGCVRVVLIKGFLLSFFVSYWCIFCIVLFFDYKLFELFFLGLL